MAISKYKIEIDSTKTNTQALFVVEYKAGNFFRLERKRGNVKTDQQWNNLMSIVPMHEATIKVYSTLKAPAVTYTKIEKQKAGTIFQQFMSEYHSFYEGEAGIAPRINAVEGKSLKMIISALKKISADEAEALATWKAMLSNWQELEAFYRKQLDLRQINSNLNSILRQIKNGKNGKSSAVSKADTIRREFTK